MKNRYFIIACAAAVIATGCAKEAMDNASLSSKTVLSVTIADGSKTTLGELSEGSRPIYWSDGDVMCCNGVSSVALSNVPEKATAAEFSFDAVLERPYNLLYPATLYKDATTVTLPAIAGNIPLGGQNGSISALTGIIKLTVKGGDHQDKISYVKVSSAAAQLSGDFCIDYAAGTLDAISNNEADKSVKAVIGKALAKDETVELFIPVPVGEYGFTVRIVDVMGHYMEKSTTAAKTIVAGQINAFPELVFTPTGTQFDVEIDSAEKWNNFATAYNEGTAEDCIVGITADLDFDGIDVVTLSGGYGSEKYFSGTIDGGNHFVKNLTSNKPLVGCINGNAILKDLTIDESCSYTVDYELGTQKHFGPLVEYVKGNVKNCHNKAAITLSTNGNANDQAIFIGGLVGRIKEGLLEDCTNSGAIFLDGTYSSSKNSQAGGIVGYMSNAEGKVKGCTNYGPISTAALCGTTMMGGIAAVCSGTIEGCTNETTGIISSAMARPTGDACKFIYYGGIAGKLNNGSTAISNVNKAEIKTTTAVKQNYMGGIVGLVEGTVTVSDNTSSGKVSSTGGARNLFMGGLYGAFANANTLTLTGSPFTGSIFISGHENSAANTYLYAGGIVGLAKAALTITGSSCTLASDITIPAASSGAKELFMGGVVGAAGATGGNALNADAKIIISGITVSGKVKMTEGSGLKPVYKMAAFGGIIGGALAGADISSCTSSSDVYFCEAGTASKSDNQPAHVGGIAGRIEGGNSTISGCAASGKVYNYLYNNNWWNVTDQIGICAAGGIIGSFGYNKDQTYTIAISNCSSSGTEYGYRGTVGGIAGYLHNATISGNISFTGSVSRGAPAGGIVGIARDCDISGCTVKTSACKGQTAGSCKGYSGGIAGYAENTAINNCKSFSTLTLNDTTKDIAGGIIGYPDASCTIGATSACAFGGKVGSTVVSAENCASLATGNTLMTVDPNVTYWDGK